MKIALLVHDQFDVSVAVQKYNPELIIKSNHKHWLAESAQQLDEAIHFNNTQIDVAIVLQDTVGELGAVADDMVYFWDNSFYCKPHVLSVISNSYKITSLPLKSLIVRLGFDYAV